MSHLLCADSVKDFPYERVHMVIIYDKIMDYDERQLFRFLFRRSCCVEWLRALVRAIALGGVTTFLEPTHFDILVS